MTRRRWIADEVSGNRAALTGDHARHLAQVLRAQVGQEFAISIFKFDRMEWAIEKSTELGVARIIPIVAARTEPHLAAAAGKRVERWRRIARQAAEQSRRVSPPEIPQPVKFDDLIA